MPRKKKPVVEIVRASSALAVPQPNAAKLEALLDRLVQQRVSEALSQRDAALFEPHFRSSRVSHEIRRHQTVSEQRRWPAYFDRWGCLACRRTKAVHAGNGYCERCRLRISQRLKAIERELSKAYAQQGGQDQVGEITSRVRDAERLLGKGGRR